MNNPLQTDTVAWAIKHQAVNNAAFTSQVIDTAELITGEIVLGVGTLPVALAALKLVESDTKTNDTTLGGTTADVQDYAADLPDADQNGKLVVLNLQRYLTGPHKRYIQLQSTAGNGGGDSDLVAWFRGISRVPLGDGKTTATDRGADVDRVTFIAGAAEV